VSVRKYFLKRSASRG